ncbi:MAG TPA: hypothetical protein VMV83_09850 [Rectinemataceae bacterium]|nr:hypothetical protein [Rectinemataceae bacterium]
MKRLSIIALSVLALLAFGACTLTITPNTSYYTNSTSTAASLAIQAGYTGEYYTYPRALASRAYYTATPSFIGSNYENTIAASSTTQSAFLLSSQPITQNGKVYYLTGTVNYAFVNGNQSNIYVYAPNINISGPDYSGNVSVDLYGVYTAIVSGTTSMSCTVYGYVGGSNLSGQSLSFYF